MVEKCHDLLLSNVDVGEVRCRDGNGVRVRQRTSLSIATSEQYRTSLSHVCPSTYFSASFAQESAQIYLPSTSLEYAYLSTSIALLKSQTFANNQPDHKRRRPALRPIFPLRPLARLHTAKTRPHRLRRPPTYPAIMDRQSTSSGEICTFLIL
jgi:hypothetical protein